MKFEKLKPAQQEHIAQINVFLEELDEKWGEISGNSPDGETGYYDTALNVVLVMELRNWLIEKFDSEETQQVSQLSKKAKKKLDQMGKQFVNVEPRNLFSTEPKLRLEEGQQRAFCELLSKALIKLKERSTSYQKDTPIQADKLGLERLPMQLQPFIFTQLLHFAKLESTQKTSSDKYKKALFKPSLLTNQADEEQEEADVRRMEEQAVPVDESTEQKEGFRKGTVITSGPTMSMKARIRGREAMMLPFERTEKSSTPSSSVRRGADYEDVENVKQTMPLKKSEPPVASKEPIVRAEKEPLKEWDKKGKPVPEVQAKSETSNSQKLESKSLSERVARELTLDDTSLTKNVQGNSSNVSSAPSEVNRGLLTSGLSETNGDTQSLPQPQLQPQPLLIKPEELTPLVSSENEFKDLSKESLDKLRRAKKNIKNKVATLNEAIQNHQLDDIEDKLQAEVVDIQIDSTDSKSTDNEWVVAYSVPLDEALNTLALHGSSTDADKLFKSNELNGGRVIKSLQRLESLDSSPARVAMKRGDDELVANLIKREAAMTSRSAFYVAVTKGIKNLFTKFFKLFSAEQNVESLNPHFIPEAVLTKEHIQEKIFDGKSALQYAIENGHTETAWDLIEAESYNPSEDLFDDKKNIWSCIILNKDKVLLEKMLKKNNGSNPPNFDEVFKKDLKGSLKLYVKLTFSGTDSNYGRDLEEWGKLIDENF
ncbi:hypothetical protein SOPP22_05375 [Shewanella sp. OPT22]|nr:hypothetical protein SOPP22_05375 [Shewanella sp. OPT22]